MARRINTKKSGKGWKTALIVVGVIVLLVAAFFLSFSITSGLLNADKTASSASGSLPPEDVIDLATLSQDQLILLAEQQAQEIATLRAILGEEASGVTAGPKVTNSAATPKPTRTPKPSSASKKSSAPKATAKATSASKATAKPSAVSTKAPTAAPTKTPAPTAHPTPKPTATPTPKPAATPEPAPAETTQPSVPVETAAPPTLPPIAPVNPAA